MPRGEYPYDYLLNPNPGKPLEEIWSDLQAYTCEFFEDEPQFYSKIDFRVILPPLFYGGKFVKGLFYSQAVDFLLTLHPELSELFFSIANSMWSSYPWSKKADGYFTCYPYPEREAWFRKTHPDQKGKILIPTQDADLTNERTMAPQALPRDIDVLAVSTLYEGKNIPMICEAIKIYRQKFYPSRIKLTLISGRDLRPNPPEDWELEGIELEKIRYILGDVEEYVNFLPKIQYLDMPRYYSRAKVFVLGSLLEGKNRAISEALCCDTPVVCFRDLSRFTRGENEIFPENSGVYTEEFHAEALADSIRRVLKNSDDFKPRTNYLKNMGRMRFFELCIRSLKPLYQVSIPEPALDEPLKNPWLDQAIRENYGLGLEDFTYDKDHFLSHVQDLEAVEKTIRYYISRRSEPRPTPR